MKALYIPLLFGVIFLAACSKNDVLPRQTDAYEWMRTHEQGVVAFVDDATGNYIVETGRGYTVVESLGGYPPREYEDQYAHFSNRGMQQIYSRTGNYFTDGRIIDYWLSWDDALYVLDELYYGSY